MGETDTRGPAEVTSLTQKKAADLVPAGELPAGRNPALVYLGKLSAGSRPTMRGALDTMAAILTGGELDAERLPWHMLRLQHTEALRAQLAERYAPATANKHLAALRGVLRAAWRLGLMNGDDYQLAASVETVKGERLPAGRSITMGELSALMQTCANDPTPAGARDAAILALLYACGLRRAELVGLDLADYDQGAGVLRILGKRNKERACYVVNGAGRALGDYLAVRGGDPGPLFWAGRRGGGLIPGQRMVKQSVYDMLKTRAQEAGIPELSPHDFRRTFVGDLLDAGADLAIVQRLAGHANVTTTARYDRRPEAAKRQASERLHVPYFGRGLHND